MTVVTSTIPALKANLYTALVALTADGTNALFKVRVSYGVPLPGASREWVWLADAQGDQEWAALGAKRREEAYDLKIVIFSSAEGTNQQAVTERCFNLAAAIETVLRTDPTVGGAVRVAGFGGGEIMLEESADPKGLRRGAQLTVTVTCRARI